MTRSVFATPPQRLKYNCQRPKNGAYYFKRDFLNLVDTERLNISFVFHINFAKMIAR